MDADLDTLATALYVTCDELLKDRPELAPWRPRVGLQPQISDAELVTLAVISAVLGFDSEARWVRYARATCVTCSRSCHASPGTTSGCAVWAGCWTRWSHHLAADTSVFTDDVLVVDSTPVECARSRETVNAPIWPAGPSTATAPPTRATSGDCACTWSPPCTGYPSPTPSPAPRPTSAPC